MNFIGSLIYKITIKIERLPLIMQTSNIQAFEDYLRRKELELSLINSKIEQEYSVTSTSYSDSPLIKFTKRIEEYEVSEFKDSFLKKKFKVYRKVIYITLIFILAFVSVILII